MKNTLHPKVTAKISMVIFFTALYNQTNKYIKANHLLIFLFAYTAISKLNLFSYSTPFSWATFTFIDATSFQHAMFKSPVLRPYVHELSYIIPISEMAVCLLLLFNTSKKIGYYLALLLLALFTVYIIYILNVYAGKLPCVCGGVISLLSWPQHLLFNFFFILITIRAIFLTHRQKLPSFTPVS